MISRHEHARTSSFSVSAHGHYERTDVGAAVPSAVVQSSNAITNLNWHAIWTRSRHEPVVCKELATKGIDAFLPTVTRVSRWSDRIKRVEWPLFPGYCFARFEPALLSKVFKCTGVVTVLSNDGHPVTIPGAEIEALQRMMASGVEYSPCAQLVPGDKVRVISGPLTGLNGRLVRRGPQELLVLAVELLNSGASVQISGWDVEPVYQ